MKINYVRTFSIVLMVILTFNNIGVFGQSKNINASRSNTAIIESVWDGAGRDGKYGGGGIIPDNFGGGDGSEATPYLITNAAEFACLAYRVNSKMTTYMNAFFKLTTDIDLRSIEWKPIGYGYQFSGMFDGDGHVIRNIVVLEPSDSNKHVGLFGLVANSNDQLKEFGVKNLNIDGGTIEGWQNIGGFVGDFSNNIGANGVNGIIENCNNAGVKVWSSSKKTDSWTGQGNNIGGIVGRCLGRVNVVKCNNLATIHGLSLIGGIVGDSDSPEVVVENCLNYGAITSLKSKIGGIVGENSGTVRMCGNTGSVDGITAQLAVSVGGIVGQNLNLVSECFNVGGVIGEEFIGGVVGSNLKFKDGINPVLRDSYNSGSVKARKNNVGGVIGSNDALGEVINTYNTGIVTSSNDGAIKGEVVGVNYRADGLTQCYYDSQFGRVLMAVGGKEDVVGSGIEGKDTRSMSGTEVSSLFQNSDKWSFILDSYPQLKSRLAEGQPNVYSRLYASVIKLAKTDTRWNKVESSFFVGGSYGIKWTSNNNILTVNGTAVMLGMSGGPTTLRATLSDVEREIPLVVLEGNDGGKHSNIVKFSGNGQVMAGGKIIPNNGVVNIRHGDMEMFTVTPADGYYLNKLTFVTIAMDNTRMEYDVLNKDVTQPNGNEFTVDFDNALLNYTITAENDDFMTTELSAEFTPAEVWDGTWEGSSLKEPFQAGATNRYLVYRPCELTWLVMNTMKDENHTIKLVNNLDFGGHSWAPPIQGESEYNGTFYGNRKTLFNINISLSDVAKNSNIGLFSVIGAKGAVHELGIIGITKVHASLVDAIDGNSNVGAIEVNVGAIAGENNGLISQCYSIASVSIANTNEDATINIGGLVGKNEGVVQYSYFHGYGGVMTTVGKVNNGGVIGWEGDTGSSTELFYDKQMCTVTNAIGNKKNISNIIDGLASLDMTSGTMSGEFEGLNALGAWLPQVGRYPVFRGSENVPAVVTGATLVKFIPTDNINNVTSNFTLNADEIANGPRVKWEVKSQSPVGSTSKSVTLTDRTSVYMAKVDRTKETEMITLTASVRTSSDSEDYTPYKQLEFKVLQELSTITLNVKIEGASGEDDKVGSGGADYTTAAVSENGANITFSTGSAALVSIIPKLESITPEGTFIPGHYLSSAKLKKTGESEFTDVLKDVSINYTFGVLIYGVAGLTNAAELILGFAEVPAWDAGGTWQPHTDGVGYLIYHPYELAWLAEQVNNIENPQKFDGKSFKLLNSIDLNSNPWKSIGGYGDNAKYFDGMLDGNKRTIKNITIKEPLVDYVGLFGYLDQGSKITDLSLEDCNIEGRNYVGGIAGYITKGRTDLTGNNVEKCIIKTSSTINNAGFGIKGHNYVGGIVGYLEYGGLMVSCHNTGIVVEGNNNVGGILGFNDGINNSSHNKGNVKGVNNVGGIVGYNRGQRGPSHVSECQNSGTVTATGNKVGGIVGWSEATNYRTTITSSFNIGTISGLGLVGGIVGDNSAGKVYENFNIGDITATEDGVGGIVGSNNNERVETCFNSGVITGNYEVGGIVGKGVGGRDGGVSTSYNTGIVIGNNYIGGIVGGMFGTIENCYSVGNLVGTGEHLGSIAGYPNYDGITDCFYDKQMSIHKGIDGVDVEETKGYLTKEIVKEGKGFNGKLAWTYDDEKRFYPQLNYFYDSFMGSFDFGLNAALLRPIFLKSEEGYTGYETVGRLFSKFDIEDASLTWTLTPTQDCTVGITVIRDPIDGPTGKTEVTVARGEKDQVVFMTGVEDLVTGYPARKIQLLVIQDDQYRKRFKADFKGAWNVADNWENPQGIPTETDYCIIPTNSTAQITGNYAAVCNSVRVDGNLVIDAGSSLTAGRVGNNDPDKLILTNAADKSASLILKDKTAIDPHLTVAQKITTGASETASPYQLISTPINTIRKGQPVVDIFDGGWLDRYNQEDAIWERYENVYHGVKHFDIERFRGYSINFEDASKSLVFKGQAFTGDAFYDIDYDSHISIDSPQKDYGGLNLIGNPYTASMKIDWTLDGLKDMEYINKVIWVWNHKNNNYNVWPANTDEITLTEGIIPACQGFWVRVNPLLEPVLDESGNPTENNIQHPNNVKMVLPYLSTVVPGDTKPLYKVKSDIPFVKLAVEGSRYADNLTIIDVNECTVDYDNGWDGEKWLGAAEAPQFYAVEGDKMWAVDAKDDINETMLNFEAGEDSQYVIKSIGSNNVEDVQLVDLKTGVTHDILTSSYAFTATKDDAKNRFILKAKSMIGVEDTATEDRCNVFSYGKMVTVVGGEGEVEVIDMQGRTIQSMKISSDRYSLTIDKTGTYVVRVIGEKGIVSRKLVIN